MVNKGVKMGDIYYAIMSKFNSPDKSSQDDISCIFSDDNSSNLILRIQYNDTLSEQESNKNSVYFYNFNEDSINNIEENNKNDKLMKYYDFSKNNEAIYIYKK